MASILARKISLTLTLGTGGLVALAAPAAAQAQSAGDELDSGLYVTGRVGVALPSDFDLEGVQAPQTPSPGTAGAPAVVDIEFDNEVSFAGAIGYKLPRRLFGVIQPSIELEYGYTSPNVEGGSFNGGNQTFGGDVEVQTFTINYQSDFVFSPGQRIVPFLGGGIGIADVDADVAYFPASATAPTFGVTGSDTAFVFQSNAGLRFDLSDTIAFDARVRYQRIDGIDLERRFIAGGNNAFSADISGDYESVNLLAGIRYSF